MARCIDAFRSQLVRLRNRATCRGNDVEEVSLLSLFCITFYYILYLVSYLIYLCKDSLFLHPALSRDPRLGESRVDLAQGVAALLTAAEVAGLRLLQPRARLLLLRMSLLGRRAKEA